MSVFDMPGDCEVYLRARRVGCEMRVFAAISRASGSSCERLSFPLNTLRKVWPHVMTPHNRIHFAGAYADNLNWGMEAATRSANRVAREIDQA